MGAGRERIEFTCRVACDGTSLRPRANPACVLYCRYVCTSGWHCSRRDASRENVRVASGAAVSINHANAERASARSHAVIECAQGALSDGRRV